MRNLVVFYWYLSVSKSPQPSRTLPCILTYLNDTESWMVSTCPLISKSSGPFTNPLRIVPNAPITIGITATFMFHSLFSSLAVLISLFAFLYFPSVVRRDGNVHYSTGFPSFVDYYDYHYYLDRDIENMETTLFNDYLGEKLSPITVDFVSTLS